VEALGIAFIVILAIAVLLAVYVGLRALPDLARYRRLRRM
jgi:hypothetical protein